MNKQTEDIQDNLDMGTHLRDRLAQAQDFSKEAISPEAQKNMADGDAQAEKNVEEGFSDHLDKQKASSKEESSTAEASSDHTESRHAESSSQVPLDASFSTLVMSLGSAALMALGLVKDPQTGKVNKDKRVAKFNIDMLIVLKEKTKGNLSKEEEQVIDAIISDLQLKYIAI